MNNRDGMKTWKQTKLILISLCGILLGTVLTCASADFYSETSGPFFTGTGGSEIRLGILVPQSKGLNENQVYLPTLIQGVLVSNMSKYSAISVLDRVSLDKVISETLDPTYEDNLDIVRLGHVAQVGYMMTGNIIRTSSGYSLQINVTDTTPQANTIASHSANVTVAQLDDQSAIQKASVELLTQMGVQLTDSAKRELNRASTSQDRNAQTALAHGIIAQQRGQTFEAITYYLNASSFEPISTEALNRMSLATTTIATGSLGNQIRNDIQQRNDWIKLIDETNSFFINNPQYGIAELYYNSELNLSSIDYRGETASLNFPVQVRLNNEKADAVIKIIDDISKGLDATGKKKQWGIDVEIIRLAYNYNFIFELIDNKGKVISTTEKLAGLRYLPNSGSYEFRKNSMQTPYIFDRFSLYPNISGLENFWLRAQHGHYLFSSQEVAMVLYFDIVGSIDDRTIDRYFWQLNERYEKNPHVWGGHTYRNYVLGQMSDFRDVIAIVAKWKNEPCFTVKASDITDTLSIRLKDISVTQYKYIEKQKKYDYVPIKKGNNIIPVHIGKM